jgi:hypothetical protein
MLNLRKKQLSKISLALLLISSNYVVAKLGNFDVRLSVLITIVYLFFSIMLQGLKLNIDRFIISIVLYLIALLVLTEIFGPFGLSIKSFISFILIMLFLFAVNEMLKSIGIKEAIYLYLNICFYVCLFGLIQILIYIYTNLNINPLSLMGGYLIPDLVPRINSIFAEPSSFGFFCYLAVAILVFDNRKQIVINKLKKVVIWTAFIASGSASAYVFLIILLIIKIWKFNIRNYLYISALLLVLVYMYFTSNGVQSRFDQVYQMGYGILFADIEKMDYQFGTSALALYNNFIVAVNSIKSSLVLGSGIGNHSMAYQEYIIFSMLPDVGLNMEDANSMYLRIVSETGLVGIIGFMYFVLRHYSKSRFKITEESSWYILINHLSLYAMLGYMLRFGSYYESLFIFYFLVFFRSNKEFRTIRNKVGLHEYTK